MPFHSWMYLYFFFIVALTFYLIPHRYRWVFLLIASVYFYAQFSAKNLLLVLLLIVVNYLAAIAIEKAGAGYRKIVLWASILAHVGLLCAFKYDNLITAALRPVFDKPIRISDLIFPIGLSYITLQSIGYVVDVYNRRQQAERNIAILALFFLFFPKIAAGPIERPVHLIPQFRQDHDFDYTRVTGGLKLIVWGLFKKILIADVAARLVDPRFMSPQDQSGISLIAAVIAFTLQIYFDFSGYSDIALGSARVLGIQLTNNFRNPYFATSISDFWQRWHISLSTWLRDYVFFPLRRVLVRNTKRQIVSILIPPMITMLVSGFWHGTGTTFILWGLLHGLFITIPPLASYLQKRKPVIAPPRWRGVTQGFKIAFTLFLVSSLWIFFRANSLSDALLIIGKILSTLGLMLRDIWSLGSAADIFAEMRAPLQPIEVYILGMFILAAFVVEYLREKGDLLANLAQKPAVLRWSLYVMVVTSLIVFGAHAFSQASQFIYFRF